MSDATEAAQLSDLPPLCMVAAVAKNRVIGLRGQLPWKIKEDMQHFRRVTTDHAVIMGRLTFDSMGKPLPTRRNIVVSRTAQAIEGCEVVTSVEAAIALARSTDREPCIIGGGQLYTLAMPYATRLEITEVQVTPEGDAWFPAIDERAFVETQRRESHDSGYDVVYRTLIRRGVVAA